MNRTKVLLLLDAWINVILGGMLLAGPLGSLSWLGLPQPSSFLYSSILGAVLFAIGLALFLEARNLGGLSLKAAIIINLCGATALAAWLCLTPFHIGPGSLVLLWLIVDIVAGIAVIEWLSLSVAKKPRQ